MDTEDDPMTAKVIHRQSHLTKQTTYSKKKKKELEMHQRFAPKAKKAIIFYCLTA